LSVASPLVLRYGGDRGFKPFESIGDDGQAQGFQIDLLNEMARAGGFSLQVQLDDWPATEQRFKAGALDAIAMVDTASRRGWAQFLRSHATPAIGLYLRQGEPDPQALTALAGHPVALHQSEALRDTRAAYLEGTGASFIETPSPLASLLAVRDGQADFALMPHAYGERLLASGVVSGVVAGTMSLRLQSYAFAVPPGASDWKPRLEAALAQLASSGRLEALRVKWLGSHREIAAQAQLQERLVQQRVVGLAAGSAGALALGGLVVLVRRRTHLAQAEGARRQQAEAALAEAQTRLTHSFTRHADAMLVAELDTGAVLDVNDALCHLVGASREALLGQPLESLPALAEPANLKALRSMLDRDGQFEAMPLSVLHARGEPRACIVSCELMSAGGQWHVFAVLRDITAQLQADEATRAAYQSLVSDLAQEHGRRIEAERSAGRFATLAAHGLKAPLHTMRGLVGLLRQRLDAGDVEQARANAKQIEQASSRMDAMVAGLARVSRLEHGELRRARVDMHAMALSICSLAAVGRAAPKVEFKVAELPPAHADPALTAQVWQQLIDNAWKFTRRTPGAKVLVDSFFQAGRTWYRVVDNGVGFDMASADGLFMPFQRMHKRGEFDGIGIGLALAQRIVRRHDGELHLRSSAGAGTVVEFTLEPLPEAPGSPDSSGSQP
jgi:PAS domain S-box-containing protein